MLHNQSLKCTIGIGAGGLQPPDSGKAIIFRANAIFFGQMPAAKMKNIYIFIYLLKEKTRNSFRPAR